MVSELALLKVSEMVAGMVVCSGTFLDEVRDFYLDYERVVWTAILMEVLTGLRWDGMKVAHWEV